MERSDIRRLVTGTRPARRCQARSTRGAAAVRCEARSCRTAAPKDLRENVARDADEAEPERDLRAPGEHQPAATVAAAGDTRQTKRGDSTEEKQSNAAREQARLLLGLGTSFG